MNRVTLITLGLLAAAPLTHANETWLCEHGSQQRVIDVVYSDPASPVPCEVTYQKADQAAATLWYSQNEAGYCEAKAHEFVEKQRGWGWQCQQHNETAAPESVTTEESDVTAPTTAPDVAPASEPQEEMAAPDSTPANN